MITKDIQQIISPTLQKIFIATTSISFVIEAVMMVQLLVRVYGLEWQFSPFLVYALTVILLPIIGVGLGYMAARKVKMMSWRLFMAVLMAVTLVLIQLIVMTLFFELSNALPFTWGWAMQLHVFAPTAVALLCYGIVLVAVYRSKLATQVIPFYLQKIFIGVSVSWFIVSAVSLVARVIQQYPTNQNLSAFLTTTIVSVVLPLVFFATAYAVKARSVSRLIRVFRSIVWAVVGTCLVGIIDRLVSILYGSASSDAGYWEMMSYSFGGYVIALGIYAALILHPIYRR